MKKSQGAYGNLKAELSKKDITYKEVAISLGLHRNAVERKIKGESKFSVEEAMHIQEKFFSDISISYLFRRDQTA